MGVRRRMWNWQRRRISTIFEYVRIVGAAFFWYTEWRGKAAFSEVGVIINRMRIRVGCGLWERPLNIWIYSRD